MENPGRDKEATQKATRGAGRWLSYFFKKSSFLSLQRLVPISRSFHRHRSTPTLTVVTMAGTWDGDTGAQGPSRDPALLSLWRPPHPKGLSMSSGQLETHGVEEGAGDARRSPAALGGVALPKTHPWAGPEPCGAPREKERTTLAGWGHQPSPAKDSLVRPGSDTGSKM